MHEKLYVELYRSHDKRTSLAAIAKIPGVRWLPFDQKPNNRGVIHFSSSPGLAVVEMVTNGLDAVINFYRPLLDSTAIDVATALMQIPGPHVDVYVQEEPKSRKKTVTVLDRGCGMSGDKMKESVLALGCEDKPMDRLQHGSLGQGGANGYGISEGTLIASRVPDSDIISFTFVCARTLDSGLQSYCYATDAKGDLFTAQVKKLPLIDPDRLRSQTDVARAVASWKPVSEGGNGQEDVLFPQQGTIRRMLGVTIQYHSGSRNTSEGLWTGLRDNLFSSEGIVRLFGDRTKAANADDPDDDASDADDDVVVRGKANDYKEKGVLRSGRAQLTAKGVGKQIAQKNSATLLLHEPYTPINVRFRDEDESGNEIIAYQPIEIELLAFSPFQKLLKGELKPATIVHDWLHAARSTEAPKGVIVTFNGQTHERLLSQNVFDTMPNLIGHVIIHVRLDALPPKFLHKAIVTTREKLNTDFATQLRKLLRDYVREGPAAIDLANLNEDLRPKAQALDTKTLNDAMARASVLLSNTMYGINLAGGSGVKGSPFRKAVPPEKPTHMGPGRKEDDGDNTGGKPNPFDPLLDRPTIIEMRKNTFIRGNEEYVTIRINAKDHLDKQVQLVLPAGFRLVAGCRPLRDGSKTYRVRCNRNATDGIFSAVYDFGDSSPFLMDRAMVKVVAKREKGKVVKEPNMVGTTPQTQIPNQRFVWVEGERDPDGNYVNVFSNSGGADFFNYRLEGDTIFVYLNTHYPRYLTLLKTIERYGEGVMEDWKQRFPVALLLASILQTDEKGGLGSSGAMEGAHFERLERIAMAQLTTILHVYDDPAMRQTIQAGYRQQQQEAMAGDD